jgi:hypothetical protein
MSRRKRFAKWIQSLPEGWFMVWSVSSWLVAYVSVCGLYQIGFKAHLWTSPGRLDAEEAFLAALSGFLAGAFELSDRHRKQETARMQAAGQDRTMI